LNNLKTGLGYFGTRHGLIGMAHLIPKNFAEENLDEYARVLHGEEEE
jgi:hypothetical protein